jgi:hypothetical protein
MSTKGNSNSKTFPGKVGSSAKSKGASLPTPLNGGGAGNAVKGQDERQHQAPLTAFPAPCPRTPFFRLTRAVVVIDRMTAVKGNESRKLIESDDCRPNARQPRASGTPDSRALRIAQCKDCSFPSQSDKPVSCPGSQRQKLVAKVGSSGADPSASRRHSRPEHSC